MGNPGQDRFEQLVRRADGLQQSVDTLVQQQKVEQERRRVDARKRRFERRVITALAVSLAVDLTLTGVIASVVNDQSETNRRLSQALRQDYLTAQQLTDTQVSVLCPTETVLLELLSLPRPAGASPLSDQQRKALASAVQTFTYSYRKLGCKPAASNSAN